MKNMLLILGIVICLVAGIVGGIIWYHYDDVCYEGKETFLTQEDYTAFKIELGKEDCQIVEAIVLPSEVPIVVEYRVRVPYDYEFPYEGKRSTVGTWSVLIFLLLPIGFMANSME